MKIKNILGLVILVLGILYIYQFLVPAYTTYQKFSSISSTENWQTYTDSKLGLSFRYPPTWQVEQWEDSYKDQYTLVINDNKGSSIIIESTNDKIFRDIQIDRIIKDYQGEHISINGLNFIVVKDKLPSDYYFYLEGSTPIKFQLLNFYSIDDFLNFSGKMDQILHNIVQSIKATK